MADAISIQKLIDASMDSDSLEVLVNGDENAQVTTRLGETYPSAKKAIKTMLENGGLPAVPFATKALMTASLLVDGKYAMVTDDTVADNNGLYVKTAGAWVKSSYDPVALAKAYIDTDSAESDIKFDNITRFISGFSSISGIVTYKGGYPYGQLSYENPDNLSAFDVVVKSGDVLRFDCTPRSRTTHLFHKKSEEGGGQTNGLIYWPLIYSQAAEDSIKQYEFTAFYDMTLRVVGAVSDTITVNGATPLSEKITSIGLWRAEHSVTSFVTGSPFDAFKVTGTFPVKKGDTVLITNPAKGSICIIEQIGTTRRAIFGYAGDVPEPKRLNTTWVAPSDMMIRLSGYANSEFLISSIAETSKAGTLSDVIKKEISSANVASDSVIPSILILPARETVFATALNYIMKTEVIDGVDHILISEDLGETWYQTPNILGDIVHTHVFADGTILLCSPTKVYWTTDYVTLNESVVTDSDGSAFVPNGRHFYSSQKSDEIVYYKGVEMYTWGDYSVDSNVKARIWYSLDSGRTIKCAAKFGTTVMDGEVRKIRHTHSVVLCQANDTFYITTGDTPSECMIFKGFYDLDLDSWSFEFLVSGAEYKLTGLFFDDIFAYFTTDYTESYLAENKGVLRVPIEGMGDINNYRYLYRADAAEWGEVALSRMLKDNNGNIMLHGDYKGIGVVWLANEGFNFKKVPLSKNIFVKFSTGINYKGDVYCIEFLSVAEFNQPQQLKLNRGSYNITKMLRDSGMKNWMANMSLKNHLQSTMS